MADMLAAFEAVAVSWFDRDVLAYLRRAGPYSNIPPMDDVRCWRWVNTRLRAHG